MTDFSKAVETARETPSISDPGQEHRKGGISTTNKKVKMCSKHTPSIGRDFERSRGEACVVVGVDEAGRGPLAGPVVAAACIVPLAVHIDGITDSKLLPEPERERLYTAITSAPGVMWAVAVLDHKTIDTLNILEATMEAMRQCVKKVRTKVQAVDLSKPPKTIVVAVDGNRLPRGIDDDAQVEALTVVKGDSKIFSIAAASILAKVTRDRIMQDLHLQWPNYGFDAHKGYGVAAHVAAIHKHGHCPIHRLSFNPVRTMVGWSRKKDPEGNKSSAKKNARYSPKPKLGSGVRKSSKGMKRKKKLAN